MNRAPPGRGCVREAPVAARWSGPAGRKSFPRVSILTLLRLASEGTVALRSGGHLPPCEKPRALETSRVEAEFPNSGHFFPRPPLPTGLSVRYWRRMKYRRFGRTELSMPVISCGGMRYQFKWQDVDPADIPRANQENLEATIHRALELGINHIETARGYGTSEMQLGAILPRLPRDKIIVQTKVAPMQNPKDFLKTFNKSMKHLKLDHVDLLSFHGLNNRNLFAFSLK